MADPESRAKRYANPPKAQKQGQKGAPGGTSSAKTEAEKTPGRDGTPTAADPGKVGKQGSDTGPDSGHDATWGVVAERHSREHADMVKRHAADHTAHADAHAKMVERHAKEAKDMHARHGKELMDSSVTDAKDDAEKTAGNGFPTDTQRAEEKGKKGTEP